MRGYMFWVAFVASLGGLLFGFDTAVISGAENAIQQIYGLNNFWHGFTIATALIGTIIGAFVCGKPAQKYGRLVSMKVIGALYLISAVGSAAVVNWYAFMIFRFIGGLAVGASSVIGPMYIAEISPSSWRGRFVAFFQFNIVLGIVCAYFSNYFIAGMPNDWQWMLGSESVPALLFTVLLFTVPESPRWLVSQGQEEKAAAIFVRTGEDDVEGEMAAIKESFRTEAGIKKERLFQKKFTKPILIAFLIATLNQLSGINAILYYAPRLLEMSGVFRDGAMLQSVIVGLTNLTFTMLGMALIDKLGRRTLIAIGAVGMVVAQAMVARGFYLNEFEGYTLLICICAYVACFALSLGATIWVVIAEVFPNSVRSDGQVLGSMTHWVWSALLTWFFPLCLFIGGEYIFAFFSIIAALSLIFAWWLPETKGKSLEQIQKELVKEDAPAPSVYNLKGGNLTMTVTDYGARVLSLMVPDKEGKLADVCVGYETLNEYVECKGERFFGAAVGRLANRLGGAGFTLDGKEYHLSANDNGNTLHGGHIGVDRLIWKVEEHAENSITFSLVDPAGNDGWPGNLRIWMKYTLTPEDEFKVEYKADTDAPTLVNLSHHTFFNLTGDASKSILDHELAINADRYIPIDEKLIPTGEIASVEGTAFDFRTPKAIGKDIGSAETQLDNGNGYDHNWCLGGDGVRKAASLYEPVSGRRMDVLTDQCGVQFYSGNFFDGSYAGKNGKVIGYRCALALETQKWPDAIHHEGFPDTVLRPGETYEHVCVYRFYV